MRRDMLHDGGSSSRLALTENPEHPMHCCCVAVPIIVIVMMETDVLWSIVDVETM
jgi:hypothetical protein